MKFALGLVHYPIYDSAKDIVATNITNLDIHDIARISKVYGADRYYLIHPMQEQLMFVSRMLNHWRVGEGAKFNPMRKTALSMVHTAESVEAAVRDWEQPKVITIGTTAREIPGKERVSFQWLRSKIEEQASAPGSGTEASAAAVNEGSGAQRLGVETPEVAYLLLFGTGFGMTEDLLKSCDYLLEPLRGAPPIDYRHLSVRSAASICLDRLRGSW